MNLTKSSHPNSAVLGSTRVEVSDAGVDIDTIKKTWSLKELEDVGLARGVKINFQSSKFEVKADNGDSPWKGVTGVTGSVECAILERYLPLIGKIMGGIVHVSIQGHPVKKFTDNHSEASIEVGKFVEFKNQNFDLALPTDIVVKQGAKTLVKNTDFEITQNKFKMWGVKFKSGAGFDASKKCVIEYSVSSIKSYTMTRGSGGIAKPLSLKLTSRQKADNGKTIERTYEFPRATYDGDDSISFKSKNDSDSVAEVPLKFLCEPHPDMLLDEELEIQSLYREVAETA